MARRETTQLAGLILWRGGLLFVAGYSAHRAARELLRWVELPRQLELGAALVLAGAALVMASLVLERIRDARAEGELRE